MSDTAAEKGNANGTGMPPLYNSWVWATFHEIRSPRPQFVGNGAGNRITRLNFTLADVQRGTYASQLGLSQLP